MHEPGIALATFEKSLVKERGCEPRAPQVCPLLVSVAAGTDPYLFTISLR